MKSTVKEPPAPVAVDQRRLFEAFMARHKTLQEEATKFQRSATIWGSITPDEPIDFSLFHEAVISQVNFPVGDFLLAHGANVNEVDQDGNTALHLAARHNLQPTIFYLMAKPGIDPKARNTKGQTAMDILEVRQNRPAAKKLRAFLGETTIHDVIEDAPGDLAAWLKRAPKDVNARGYENRTPLHTATLEENVEAARLLIEKGAEVNAQDKHGNTVLHLARTHAELAELFIKAGAKVNRVNKRGKTPLDEAVRPYPQVSAEAIKAAGGVTSVHYGRDLATAPDSTK